MKINEKINLRKMKYRCMGISNNAYCKQERKMYSVQFYDYDFHNGNGITNEELSRIVDIFPFDIILYRTKHGIHFISFALYNGTSITKARAIQTSKDLGFQDYWSKKSELVLRISPKWKIKRLKKTYRIISKKPNFLKILRNANNCIISKAHLEFYHNFMNLPDYIYYQYDDLEKKNCELRIYHYKAKD